MSVFPPPCHVCNGLRHIPGSPDVFCACASGPSLGFGRPERLELRDVYQSGPLWPGVDHVVASVHKLMES